MCRNTLMCEKNGKANIGGMTVKSQWEQATQEKVEKWIDGSFNRLQETKKFWTLNLPTLFLLYLILIKQTVPYTHRNTHIVYYIFSCECQMLARGYSNNFNMWINIL